MARRKIDPNAGKVRVYPMVKTDCEDVVEAAMKRMRDRGWTVLEEDYSIHTIGAWTQVTLWAIPPRIEEQAEEVAS